jgi:hypothetical protein
MGNDGGQGLKMLVTDPLERDFLFRPHHITASPKLLKTFPKQRRRLPLNPFWSLIHAISRTGTKD